MFCTLQTDDVHRRACCCVESVGTCDADGEAVVGALTADRTFVPDRSNLFLAGVALLPADMVGSAPHQQKSARQRDGYGEVRAGTQKPGTISRMPRRT